MRPLEEDALGQRPSSSIAYWNQRERASPFHGPWTCTGRSLHPRRGRLLHVLRPRRRHAQGRRDMGLGVRGGERADPSILRSPRRRSGTATRRGSSNHAPSSSWKPRHTGRASFAGRAEGLREIEDRALKYPRWIDFVESLPKTANGKIQRFQAAPNVRDRGRHRTSSRSFAGRGSRVLYLHEGLGSARQWRDFRPRRPRLVRRTAAGYGSSDPTPCLVPRLHGSERPETSCHACSTRSGWSARSSSVTAMAVRSPSLTAAAHPSASRRSCSRPARVRRGHLGEEHRRREDGIRIGDLRSRLSGITPTSISRFAAGTTPGSIRDS